jgi:hypothetical protein
MAKAFKNTKGSAVKGKVATYTYKDGDNRIRLVGDVLARYVYWIKGENGKDLPFECLAFNRDEERFDNAEVDHVKEYYPQLKCGWAYAVQAFDAAEGADKSKIIVVNLKKKLFEAIILAAEDLGDPTDPDTGWDVVFRKVKTGPLPINVEYQLQVLKCKPRPLDATERATLATIKSMDELLVRPTAAAQKELLDKLRSGATSENIDEEIDEEFEVK